jgi:hypothetical protein
LQAAKQSVVLDKHLRPTHCGVMQGKQKSQEGGG